MALLQPVALLQTGVDIVLCVHDAASTCCRDRPRHTLACRVAVPFFEGRLREAVPRCRPWCRGRYLIIGVYVGVATVGVFIYWFCFYTDANDGHSLVSFDQLRLWNKCDAAALSNPSSLFHGFSVADSGGIEIGSNPCKCVAPLPARRSRTALAAAPVASPFPPSAAASQRHDHACMSAATVPPCSWSRSYFHDGKIKAVSMALSVLVVIEMLNAMNALSEDGSLLTMPPWCNPWLLVAIVVSLGLHMVIMYVPALAGLFEITALDFKVRHSHSHSHSLS